MIDKCPICNSQLLQVGNCSNSVCHKVHEFTFSGGNFADFYLGKYVVEYHYNDDGTFKCSTVIINGELNYMHIMKDPLDFTKDPHKLLQRIEKMQIYK